MHLIPSWIRISISRESQEHKNSWWRTKIVFLKLIFEIISHSSEELKDMNVKNESDEKSLLNERKVVKKLSAMHLRKVRWWREMGWLIKLSHALFDGTWKITPLMKINFTCFGWEKDYTPRMHQINRNDTSSSPFS